MKRIKTLTVTPRGREVIVAMYFKEPEQVDMTQIRWIVREIFQNYALVDNDPDGISKTELPFELMEMTYKNLILTLKYVCDYQIQWSASTQKQFVVPLEVMEQWMK